MKRVLYITFAAAAALTVSCQKEGFNAKSNQVEISINGAVENGDTKVTYTKDASAYKFAWEADDAFSLIVADGTSENANVQFTNKDGEAGNNKKFTGTVTSWEGQKNVYAVYPYNAKPTDAGKWFNFEVENGESYDAAKLKLSVNCQIIAANDTAQTSVLIASSKNVAAPSALTSLSFKQTMSIFGFNITNVPAGYKVTSVSFHCDEAVFPTKAEFSFSSPEAAPTVLACSKDINSVVKNTKEGEATKLYFSVVPTDKMNGKTIYIQVLLKGASDSRMLNLKKTGKTFVRNTFYTINADCAAAASTSHTGSCQYEGVTYNTVCMRDGNWWFSQNLRYLPSTYPTPSSDLNNVTAGVYYPIVLSSAGGKVEFSTEQSVIESNGYLYQSEVALGLKVGDITSIEQAKSLEGTQGICPEGWHIPTASDILNLVGRAVSPFPDANTPYIGAPYYDTAAKNSSMSLLNADGFNANAWGAINISDNTKTAGSLMGYLKNYPNGVASGYVCGSTFMKHAEKDGAITNYQFLAFMPMMNSSSFNGSALGYRIGASVRCVRRATADDFE